MKRNFRKIAAALLGTALVASLAACGGSKTEETTAASEAAGAVEETTAAQTEAEAASDDKVITVGASPSPHAEILNAVSDLLADEGWELKVVEYNDYVQPNLALESGELDANYFQHYPYLEDFNKENGTKIVSAGAVHYEPFGIYAGKCASLEELSDGAKIAVPNDTTNEARALLLLADNGLITLKEDAGLSATKNDITENPHNYDIVEIEAAQLPRSLQDVDVAVINGNYAIEAGLQVSDALVAEKSDSIAATTYANIVAVKEGDENSEKTLVLVDALTSETARRFIEGKYDGAVVPIF